MVVTIATKLCNYLDRLDHEEDADQNDDYL